MKFQQRNRPSAETSLASISDLVFLLLIFFMISSTFVTQAGVKIELPKSRSQKPSPGKYSVTITKEGDFYWNSEKIERKQVRDRIEAAFVKDPNNKVITLRTDQEVIMRDAAVVISPIAEFGGTVVIATKKE